MTLELPPRLPEGQRPSDFASLAAEQMDLENAINELLLRLADHKDRWELYEFGLDASAALNGSAPSSSNCRWLSTPVGGLCLTRFTARCTPATSEENFRSWPTAVSPTPATTLSQLS